MKKLLIVSAILLALFPTFSYAQVSTQSSTQVTTQDTLQDTIRQLIALLTQKLVMLQKQLADQIAVENSQLTQIQNTQVAQGQQLNQIAQQVAMTPAPTPTPVIVYVTPTPTVASAPAPTVTPTPYPENYFTPAITMGDGVSVRVVSKNTNAVPLADFVINASQGNGMFNTTFTPKTITVNFSGSFPVDQISRIGIPSTETNQLPNYQTSATNTFQSYFRTYGGTPYHLAIDANIGNATGTIITSVTVDGIVDGEGQIVPESISSTGQAVTIQ